MLSIIMNSGVSSKYSVKKENYSKFNFESTDASMFAVEMDMWDLVIIPLIKKI